MKCINCQSEIKPDFRFCPICGIEIVHLSTQTEEIYFEDRGNYPDGFDPELYNL
jgi:predicted amidophosphoribosyltransferase